MPAVRITTLDNGVTVASEHMPGAVSVSAGVWLDWGSRDEVAATHGLCHFYEHMVFKGTQRRSALQIAREIEDRGGHLNAFTTKEHICFYTRTVRADLPLALDLLSDLVLHPSFDAEEARRERGVVIEEIRGYEDTPDDVVQDYFAAVHFGEHGIAHPVTGTAESVRNFGRTQLLTHQRRVLQRVPILVVVAGRVDHDWLVQQCTDMFAVKTATIKPKRPLALGLAGNKIVRRDVQQSNLVMGATIEDGDVTRRLALSLFNIILGEGMSSRLFQEVREKRGLAYSVYSAIDSWGGSRTLTISLGTDPSRAQNALDAITAEIEDLRRSGLRLGELERAKSNLLGNLQLGLDSPSNRMNRLARQLLRRGQWTPPAQTVKQIRAVQHAHVTQVIEQLFSEVPWALAAVLPRKGKAPQWRSPSP